MRTTLRILVALVLALAPAGPSTAIEEPLDGFAIGHVPRGAGPSVSEFAYEPDEGIRCASRVWERATDDGGHSVDLTVVVLRGASLTSLGRLRSFMARHHERAPGSWSEVMVGARPGLRADGHVFWLMEPGVAVSVTIDTGRFGPGELKAVAEGVRPA
ncbi:hypothetical protein [Nonomuraea dietziae]|uniref:hypothetical protein n=1 Tax=Nonomuraea dietziae TaxID=65515 RepID=UPI0034406540